MSDEPEDAPAPFSGAPDPDNHYAPDFILRSSDGVDFHVHKEMLKLVSGFFDGMFRLPTGNTAPTELWRDGIPVLAMSEPERVLHGLLRLAYPAQSVDQYALEIHNFDEIVDVHEAAYKLQFVRVHRLMNQLLQDPAFLDAHPYRLFAIAQLRDLPELARAAALHTLKSAVGPAHPTFPEMKLLTWADAYKLYNFHRVCGVEAQNIAKDESFGREITVRGDMFYHQERTEKFVWWEFYSHDAPACAPGVGHTPLGHLPFPIPPQWLGDHIDQISSDLRLSPSHHEVEREVLNITPSARAILDACRVCSEKADRHLAIFASQFAGRIKASNEKLVAEIF
ncbi:hypothetical protein B0H16DRAFT_1379025 [Mycena metata]|uniref:BTB domain-containing protein n=1 Tax=Mycena metata TaxID=1033252 RepID=A0AAD7ICW3_9AGAR|nr:hypothetical protein B0H16DRAFT_1379025 [Mycena metata]